MVKVEITVLYTVNKEGNECAFNIGEVGKVCRVAGNDVYL